MTERLFVAVIPPEPVRDRWEEFLEPRRDAERGFRWTVPEAWHLTCAFMPSVSLSQAGLLEDLLSEVASRTAPFAVRVGGSGAFPDPERAKVLWLGVRSGSEDLLRLSTRCRNAAVRCGIEVEGERSQAHLTIARARPTNARRWLMILDAIEPAEWTVADFALMRSRMLRGGTGYETLARWPLTSFLEESQSLPV